MGTGRKGALGRWFAGRRRHEYLARNDEGQWGETMNVSTVRTPFRGGIRRSDVRGREYGVQTPNKFKLPNLETVA